MTYTPGRVVGSPEQDIYQGPDDPGTALPYGTPYTWHEVDALGQHVDTHYKVAGRPDLAASQSSTFARRPADLGDGGALKIASDGTPSIEADVELTAGQNITLTPGAGTLTIDAAIGNDPAWFALPRSSDGSAIVALAASGTAKLTYSAEPAPRTKSFTKVRVRSGTTAAGATPTLCKLFLFEEDPSTDDVTVKAVTANDTALFAGTSTAYERDFMAAGTITAGRRWGIGILVVTGAALPTFRGQVLADATEAGLAPRLVGNVAGLTDVDVDDVFTAASISNSAHAAYGLVRD